MRRFLKAAIFGPGDDDDEAEDALALVLVSFVLAAVHRPPSEEVPSGSHVLP